jgi:predicted RNA-binding Zn-ribbon protein involved in translation (DUF1610 family)
MKLLDIIELTIQRVKKTFCKTKNPVISENQQNNDVAPNKNTINELRKTDRQKFEDNLWDNICPICGKDMDLRIHGCFDQFSDHWCTHCGFITKMELLV